SQGKINFDTFRKAMEAGMGGAALKSGSTFKGALANVQAALGRLGASVLTGVFPQIRDGMNGLIPILDSLGPAATKAGEVLGAARSEEHTSELQSRENLVCRLLLEKK